MSDGIGYLLPNGDAYTDDIACTLVFYPNKDEYRRALLGSLHYLATWVAWERDSAKRGKDAARAWKNANDETMECWQMSCLDGLIADVAAIRQLLIGMGYCCDGTITYDPPTVVDPPFVPGVGDPPANYGETPIADWDEWTEYACYNANAYVDYLIQQANDFAAVAQTGAWTIGLVAAALALLSFTGIGLPIAYALASTVLFGLLQAGSTTFDGVADDLEDAREDIRCAIILGESLEDAVGAAIGTGSAAWTLLFSHVDYGSAASIIQSGGYGGEYLPAETSANCATCGEPVFDVDASFDFSIDNQGWTGSGSVGYGQYESALGVWAIKYSGNNGYCRTNGSNVNAYSSTGTFTSGHTYTYQKVTIELSKQSASDTTQVMGVRLLTPTYMGTGAVLGSVALSAIPVYPTTATFEIDLSSVTEAINPPGSTDYVNMDTISQSTVGKIYLHSVRLALNAAT